MSSQITSLHPKISRHFNLDELALLCFQLDIGYQDLAGETISKKILSFLEYIVRHGDEEALLTLLEKERRHVAWRVGPPADLVNPYKGLTAFGVDDAAYFFGRKEVTNKLLKMVRKSSLVAVLGASGSGKSSLVFAGLVAKAANEGVWLTASFRPGKEPFVSIAGALLEPLEGELSETSRLKELDNLAGYLAEKPENLGRVLARILKKHLDKEYLLLVVDQFEELYTLVPEADDRHAFVNSLLAVRNVDGVRLVVTMRADFLGQALTYPPLVAALQNSDLKLGPMTTEELKEAIAEPAGKVGITFAPGLEERILHDVVDEPGYLPLLQFALTRLWDEQQAGQLTHTGYEEIRGVAGALVQYANETFENLDAAEQETARQIFTRLVRPGLGTEDTRRVATKSQLEKEWELVQWLATKRLVVTGRNEMEEETAEIVHEALIQRWGKLRKWLEADREFLTWREGLGTAVTQWVESGKDEGVLLRGSVLVTAETWIASQKEALSSQESSFIYASIAYREAKFAEVEEQRQRETAQALQIAEEEQKRSMLFRRALVGGGILILILIAAILFAQSNLEKANVNGTIAAQQAEVALIAEAKAVANENLAATRAAEAEQTLTEVERQRRLSLARALAMQSNSMLEQAENDTELALLLAIESARLSLEDGDRVDWLIDNSLRSLLYELLHFNTSFRGHKGSVNSLAFSPNGKTLVSGSGDTTIRLWDMANPAAEPMILRGYEYPVGSVAFSPDGTTLASTSGGDTIHLWNLADPTSIPTTLRGHKANVRSIAISPDGAVLASSGLDGDIRLWNLINSTIQPIVLKNNIGFIDSLAFSPDGKTLAGGSTSKGSTISLWNLADPAAEPNTLRGHENSVRSLAFSPDGKTLASGSDDNTIRLWSIANPAIEPSILRGHEGSVQSLAFSPDGKTLASGSSDNTISLWDLDDPMTHPMSLRGHKDTIQSLAFSPDGTSLASGSSDSTIRLWKLTGPLARPVMLHIQKSVDRTWVFSQGGNSLAIGTSNAEIHVWNLSKPAAEPQILNSQESSISSLAISSNGVTLASGYSDTIRLWNLNKPTTESVILRGHLGYVSSLAFSPDDTILASGGHDGTIRLWDMAEPTSEPVILYNHWDNASSLAFSPDGTILASGHSNEIRLWNFDRPVTEPVELRGYLGPISMLLFSPDGNTLASVGREDTIYLWDMSELSTEPVILRGHRDWVNSLAFSPDGTILASGGHGGTIRLWDMAVPSTEAVVLYGHSGLVSSLAFSSDDTTLTSSGQDHSFRLWFLLEELVNIGCQKVRRNLTWEEWLRYLPSEPYRPTCSNLPSAIPPTQQSSHPTPTLLPTITPIPTTPTMPTFTPIGYPFPPTRFAFSTSYPVVMDTPDSPTSYP